MPDTTETSRQGQVQPAREMTAWERVFLQSHPSGILFHAEAAGAPAAAPPAPAPADPGQGNGTAGGSGNEGGFNWGLFPDVPEDQRSSLEPHLKTVQGHVTRLEQQTAALKPLADQGLSAQDAASLANFSTALSQDPVGTVLGLLEDMQKQGLIHNDLDLAAVTQIARDGDTAAAPAAGNGAPAEGEVSPELQQLRKELEQLKGTMSQREQAELTQKQEAALNQALTGMRAQLSEAGVSDDAMPPEELMVSAIIVNNGNAQQALDQLKGYRDATLKGFTDGKTNGAGKELNAPKGAPAAPDRKAARSSDSFKQASAAAQQALTRVNQEAQE